MTFSLFWCELLLVARRGGQLRLRMIYVALLLIALAILYDDINEYHATPAMMARFGESFVIMFLILQLAVVILLTPALAGGAIIDEKNRKSLDFLLTSPLNSRAIILGKFAARIAAIGSIIIAGWPVLLLTLFFGGVDPEYLLMGFIVTLATLFGMGAFSTMLSINKPTINAVILLGYVWIILLSILGLGYSCYQPLSALSPCTTMGLVLNDWLDGTPASTGDAWQLTGMFVVLYTLSSVIFLGVSVRILRQRNIKGAPIPRASDRKMLRKDAIQQRPLKTMVEVPAVEPKQPLVVHGVGRRTKRIKGDENPLLWKERHFTHRYRGRESRFLYGCGILLASAFVMIMIVALIISIILANMDKSAEYIAYVIYAYVSVLAIILPLLMGLRTATSVGRERQQQTLDSLFTLPGPRKDILKAKWQASSYWARHWILSVVIALLTSTGWAINPLSSIFITLHFLSALILLNTAALFASVYCRTPLRATILFLCFMSTIYILPLVIKESTRSYGTYSYCYNNLLSACLTISPPLGYSMDFDCHDQEHTKYRYSNFSFKYFFAIHFLFSTGVYLAASWVLWKESVARFRKEGKQ